MLLTVCETSTFSQRAKEIWSDSEREQFIVWIAANLLIGDVIPNTGGLRKVRWQSQGRGKRGGARVIYYNVLEDGEIYLLMIYTKNKFDDLPLKLYKILKETIHG
ncbi:transcriptional regulator [Parasutterella excrementihominis]|uniref:transcriptional regulator n=1 Tax=Parasutterella excrementihominis TaxID=487175 RepID=UPI0025B11BDB|nr:transcriptional regulator [Parasutterella excrementihominis]